jgi:formylglycine-generating enzyme required for sulfatase activity
MGAKSSPQVSMFEKLLQGFKIGDLPYADFQYHLKRLLSTGAPPEDLMAVLRRDVIEPLPEYARDEVQRLLVVAAEQTTAQNADPSAAATQPVENARAADASDQAAAGPAAESEHYQAELRTARDSIAARDANIGRLRRLLGEQDDQLSALEARVKVAAQLSADFQAERNRAAELAKGLAEARAALASEQSNSAELDRALSEQLALNEAAQLREEEVQRQSEHYQAELRTARESLAGLQREHDKSRAALASQAQISAQLETELRASQTRAEALAGDLSNARAALEAEKSKSREIGRALEEKTALSHSTLARSEELQRESERYQGELRSVRDALVARDKTIAQVRNSLSERNAHLSAVQVDRDQIVASLEKRAKTLQAELQAARTRIEELASEVKAGLDAAAALQVQRERDESQLRSLRAKLGATQTQSSSYLEVLQTHEWRKGFDENRFRESDAGHGVLEEAKPLEARSGVPKAEADHAPKPALKPAPKLAPAKPRQTEPAVNKTWSLPLAWGRSWTRGVKARAFAPRAIAPRTIAPRTIGVGAAIAALAIAGWLVIHLGTAPSKVPAVAAGAAPNSGTVIRDCPRCPAVTVLPAGRFIQGSDRPGSGSPFEKPLHWVAISRVIAMSTNAVTVDEFSAFVAATGRDMRGCDTYDGEWKHRPENSWENPAFVQTESHPVTCVSWNDAKAYTGWLSTTTGHRYRLPSASEWEYASRSGGEAVQPWNPDGRGACENANVADQSAAGRYPGWVIYACNDAYVYTAPVGSFKANAFGLHDMLGNVFQWTEDCWYPDYVGAPIDGTARTAATCSEHELRGGSWFTNPAFVRADYRNHFDADYRTSTVGIRIVRELAP